jgi:hypothetical protein
VAEEGVVGEEDDATGSDGRGGEPAPFGEELEVLLADDAADGLEPGGEVGGGLEAWRGLEDDAAAVQDEEPLRVAVDTGGLVSLIARGRFDERDFTLNRGEVSAMGSYGPLRATAGYVFMRENPLIGVLQNRQQARGQARVALSENWLVAGSFTYDLQHRSMVSQGLGIAYRDECVTMSLTYAERHDRFTDEVNRRQVTLRIDLRTLGGHAFTRRLD